MNEPFPRSPDNKCPIGRLLEEISWEGGCCKRLRDGERKKENMLTTEVFQALDLLPREEFLGRVFSTASGVSVRVCEQVLAQIENLCVTVLPGNTYLRPSETAYSKAVPVQPDVLIESGSIYCFAEAKALSGYPSFQPEQLARQFVAVKRDAGNRVPLLLLVLPEPAPIRISGLGKKEIYEAIMDDIGAVVTNAEGADHLKNTTEDVIAETVGWIVWDKISEVVKHQVEDINNKIEIPRSLKLSIARLATTLTDAIDWHR